MPCCALYCGFRIFANRIDSAAQDSNEYDQIKQIVGALQVEASAEDEEGGVSLGAVASSLLARWVEYEYAAARTCEAAMGPNNKLCCTHTIEHTTSSQPSGNDVSKADTDSCSCGCMRV